MFNSVIKKGKSTPFSVILDILYLRPQPHPHVEGAKRDLNQHRKCGFYSRQSRKHWIRHPSRSFSHFFTSHPLPSQPLRFYVKILYKQRWSNILTRFTIKNLLKLSIIFLTLSTSIYILTILNRSLSKPVRMKMALVQTSLSKRKTSHTYFPRYCIALLWGRNSFSPNSLANNC